MKTYYIEKEDKHRWAMCQIKIEQDDCKIYTNLEKGKNIKKSDAQPRVPTIANFIFCNLVKPLLFSSIVHHHHYFLILESATCSK